MATTCGRSSSATTSLITIARSSTSGATDLDLSGANGSFSVKWFNPRTGGKLVDSVVRAVPGGAKVSLGTPPAEAGEDWLAVIRRP